MAGVDKFQKIPYHTFSWFYFDFEQEFDPEPATVFWREKWHYCFYICVAYLMIIFGLQRVMRPYKPFNLRVPLVLWNVCMAVFSIWGAARMDTEMVHMIGQYGFYDSICVSRPGNGWSDFALTGIAFAASKPVELGDTLFVVLRKKPLIFLHWYHHVTVLVFSWFYSQDLWPTNKWFTAMNYTVHAMMYTYYAIRAAGLSCPKLVSMSITTMQLTQFVIGCSITAIVIYLKYIGVPCNQSDVSIGMCAVLNFSYLVLFAHFFKNAYCGRKPRKSQPIKDHYAITGVKMD